LDGERGRCSFDERVTAPSVGPGAAWTMGEDVAPSASEGAALSVGGVAAWLTGEGCCTVDGHGHHSVDEQDCSSLQVCRRGCCMVYE